MIETYWNIGRRIVEEEQQGKERAEYGEHIIENLAKKLTCNYGNGFSSRYLRSFRQFYIIVPDIMIWKSRFPNLSWTHIFKTLRVENNTTYYERHFATPSLPVEGEKPDKLELLKNPIVAEFLGFKQDYTYSEQELESAIISHLQEFLMEMGRGFVPKPARILHDIPF